MFSNNEGTMSKKNRKNNKNKKVKGKESDCRSSNSSNNNRNNNNSIPTVVNETVVATTNTTTTTTVLTQEDLEHINNTMKLKGYPRSTYFVVGYRLMKPKTDTLVNLDAAADAFKRGAENDGCVPCLLFYVVIQYERSNFYLLMPYAFEGAIRGHFGCMVYLVMCYNKSYPVKANALSNFWVKTKIESGGISGTTDEERKNAKKTVANRCYVCNKIDTVEKTFEKCGICKYYSYCGKNCQTYHWKEEHHMGECRQLKILREYCKSRHVKEIRDAIMSGVDPKEIPRLQNLRTILGLNRPKEEYEELLLRLGDDNDSTLQDRYNYLTARKDGTVHIGSTPKVI